MTRLVVYSNAPVGREMSSIGIRCYHLARELSGEFAVTLIAPGPPDVRLDSVRTAAAPLLSELTATLASYDVVVAQRLPSVVMRRLAATRTRVVYDLYIPAIPENLSYLAAEGAASGTPLLLARAESLTQQVALATGDAFVCASERQRDFWLGMLDALGRLDAAAYRADPTLRSLVDVVPFGLPSEPPAATRRLVKGVIPGIDENDRVLLWLGGVVDWTDPVTVIRAVARIASKRSDVKLLFVGMEDPPRLAMARRAADLARSLGLLDRAVFFLGWVPYEERQGYLLEADLGVAAYFESLQSRLCFHSRPLDYFWAGLPVVTTRGDALGDLVAERDLGRAVAFGDVDGFAAAVEELLDDGAARERTVANLAAIRPAFEWRTVVEPLLRLAWQPARPAGSAPARLRLEDAWVRARLSLALRGPAGLARRLAAGR